MCGDCKAPVHIIGGCSKPVDPENEMGPVRCKGCWDAKASASTGTKRKAGKAVGRGGSAPNKRARGGKRK